MNALLLDVVRRQEWQKYTLTFRNWVDLAIRKGIEEQRAATPEDGGDDAFIETAPASRSLAQQAPPVRAEAYELEEEVDAGTELRKAIITWFSGLPTDERERL